MDKRSEIAYGRDFTTAWTKANALYARWAAVHHISYPELMVLYAMYAGECSTQKEIAANYGLTKQTVSTVITRFKANHYVHLEPSKGDKREKKVVFTEAGRAYAEHYMLPLLAAEQRVYSNIEAERFTQMVATMDLFTLLFEREVDYAK